MSIVLELLSFPTMSGPKIPATCVPGVTLKLSAPESSKGSLLLLEVRSRMPMSDLSGEWNGRNVAFWQATNSQPESKTATGDLRRALLGVDLEKAPGTYPVVVNVRTPSGKPATCTVQIPILKGKFATESLYVEKEFVEPNPEQIQRANEERDRLRAIFDQVTPQKLWTGELSVPLDAVTTASTSGTRRILNGQPCSPPSRVDFPAPTGTSVHAAQNG